MTTGPGTFFRRGKICALTMLSLLTACNSGAGRYAGVWSRDLSNEGTVQMTVGSDGMIKISLPEPRWAGGTIEGKAVMRGDTLTFNETTGSVMCDHGAGSQYLLRKSEGELTVAGVGMDPCGARHAALVGTWKKA